MPGATIENIIPKPNYTSNKENQITMSASAFNAFAEYLAKRTAKETILLMNSATMNVTDYAKHVGKSRTTIYKMINRSELKTNRHGDIYINQNFKP